MAENRNDRDREKESTGDELEERNRTSRQGQNAETDRDRKSAGEPTDTLDPVTHTQQANVDEYYRSQIWTLNYSL